MPGRYESIRSAIEREVTSNREFSIDRILREIRAKGFSVNNRVGRQLVRQYRILYDEEQLVQRNIREGGRDAWTRNTQRGINRGKVGSISAQGRRLKRSRIAQIGYGALDHQGLPLLTQFVGGFVVGEETLRARGAGASAFVKDSIIVHPSFTGTARGVTLDNFKNVAVNYTSKGVATVRIEGRVVTSTSFNLGGRFTSAANSFSAELLSERVKQQLTGQIIERYAATSGININSAIQGLNVDISGLVVDLQGVEGR